MLLELSSENYLGHRRGHYPHTQFGRRDPMTQTSILTWLLHSDFCASRNFLRQLVPGIVGAQQPFFHMTIVAATVTDFCPLDSEAEEATIGMSLKLQAGTQALLLSIGAIFEGRVVCGL